MPPDTPEPPPSSSSSSSSSSVRESITHHYTQYISHGGDGPDVLTERASILGYDSDFLRSIFQKDNDDDDDDEKKETNVQFDIDSYRHLFSTSCGSGCPLRLLPKRGDVPQLNTIIDFGCGSGHDVILASRLLCDVDGRVIGIDLTDAMLDQARNNAMKYDAKNVSFYKGSIDDVDMLKNRHDGFLLEEGMADLVISNGVINLTNDKRIAFMNAFRLLRRGGMLLLSDVCKVDDEEKEEEEEEEDGTRC